MSRVLVIGGTNTDIVGMTDAAFSLHDSNPGRVSSTAGGVGRNVAENLARLGLAVTFVTAFGDDEKGHARRQECEAAGIDVNRAVATPSVPGSVYLAILDEEGDLVVAVSDMRALDAIGPDEIAVALKHFAEPDALVLDANLGPATLVKAREIVAGPPLFLECVSAAKAPRLTALLAGSTAVHANVFEAEALTGCELEHSLDGATAGARAIADLGVEAAYVTAGHHGIAYASQSTHGGFTLPERAVVNATGAGDAFMAGVVTATLSGRTARESAAFAAACAAVAMRSADTVSPELDLRTVQAEMEAMEQ